MQLQLIRVTNRAEGQRGSLPAEAGSGPNKVASWPGAVGPADRRAGRHERRDVYPEHWLRMVITGSMQAS